MFLDPTTFVAPSLMLSWTHTLYTLELWECTDTELLEERSLRDTLMLLFLEDAKPTFCTLRTLDLFTTPPSVLMLSCGSSTRRTMICVSPTFTRELFGEPIPPRPSRMSALSTVLITMETTEPCLTVSSCKEPWESLLPFTEPEDRPVASSTSPILLSVSRLQSITPLSRETVLRFSTRLPRLAAYVMLLVSLPSRLESKSRIFLTPVKKLLRTSWK
mmetsp:Transcript_14636/g.21500  ORF Transcript_14636/g.21500 Transcript_14636/m.21500 type:complete len:217 (+) Transcript_14636:599-1249(+)